MWARPPRAVSTHSSRNACRDRFTWTGETPVACAICVWVGGKEKVKSLPLTALILTAISAKRWAMRDMAGRCPTFAIHSAVSWNSGKLAPDGAHGAERYHEQDGSRPASLPDLHCRPSVGATSIAQVQCGCLGGRCARLERSGRAAPVSRLKWLASRS